MTALCVSLLTVSLLAPFSNAAELLGPAPVYFFTCCGSVAVALGDFNEDTALDLVLANHLSDTVSVLLGDGLGGFSRSVDLPVGDNPFSVVLGEFNSDGALDLAVANASSDTVSILMGDGLGSFSRTAELGVGAGPRSVVRGDFNLDGVLDLAVANESSDTVTILVGDGFGGFSRAGDLQVGRRPSSLAVGDFNVDGAQDIVVANEGVLGDPGLGTVSILLGDGRGNFFRAGDFEVGQAPSSVAVADFNSDGAPDLAVANTGSFVLSVLLGDGVGGFSQGIDIPTSPSVAVVVGDFNGDKAWDLAVGPDLTGSWTITIFLGDGLGGFSQAGAFHGGESGLFAAIGDLNGDGASDLVTSLIDSTGRGGVVILLGDGLGGFTRIVDVFVSGSPKSFAPGDFNSDGAVDLAVANEFGADGKLQILLGDGLGGLSRSLDLGLGGESSSPSSVGVGDFDADGVLDLAVADESNGTIRIFKGDGFGGFSTVANLRMEGIGRALVVGDFSNDGALDLAVTDGGHGAVIILLGDGSGGFSRASDVQVGQNPISMATADFDADGALDLAVANFGFFDDPGGTVSVLLGGDLGDFSRTFDLQVGEFPASVAVGDFDANRIPDLAIANSSFPGRLGTYLGDGFGGFSRGAEFQLGHFSTSVAVADFNADGAQDLAVANMFGPTISILLGDGLGGFSRTPDLHVSQPLSVGVVDLNSDGAPDLAFLDRESLGILLNQISTRTDVNGTNRVDGFDVSELGRLAGCRSPDPCYRRNADVDLNTIIDGDDLTFVSSRFGVLSRAVSPLRGNLDPFTPRADPDTVTFQAAPSDGDVLTVQIVVNDTNDPVAAASFAVTFDVKALEFVGFRPGTYLSGTGVLQIFNLDDATPGRVGIAVARFPPEDKLGSGPEPLLSLFLKARSEGQTILEFGPFGHSQPVMLNASGQEVSGTSFVGGAKVIVDASAGGPPGQRIGLSPVLVDFGRAEVGKSVRRKLRISNFGFSELVVSSVASSLPEVTFFSTDPFTVPAFGYVEMPLMFSPIQVGSFSGDLVISSNDPLQSMALVALIGKSLP